MVCLDSREMRLLEIERHPGREQNEEVSCSSAPCVIGEHPSESDCEHRCDQRDDSTADDDAAVFVAQTENRGGGADGLEMERTIGVEAGISEPAFRPFSDEPDLPFVRV